MGIEADLKWELQSPEVLQANNYRQKINRDLSIMWTQSMAPNGAYTSLETRKQIRRNYNRVQKINEQIMGTNVPQFDRLVFEDILRNVGIAEKFCEFRYDPKSSVGVEKFVNYLFGDNTYGRILEDIKPKNFPHKAVHKHGELTHDKKCRQFDTEDVFSGDRFSPEFENARKKILGKIDSYKTTALEFYKDLGVTDSIRGLKFEFCPAGYSFSYWDDPNMMVHLDPDRAYFYRDKDGKLVLDDTEISPIAIHEVAHGLHTLQSRKSMPAGLDAPIEEYLPMIHGTHAEGIALRTELFWLEYQKEKKDITTKERKFIELEREIYLATKLPQVAYDLLSLKAKEQEKNPKLPDAFKMDADQTLARISGIKKFGEFASFYDRPVDDTLQQMTYLVGNKRTGKLVDKLKNAGLDNGEIMTALFQGCWCDQEAQEKFLFDFYLEGKN